jgi:hypothetical protein
MRREILSLTHPDAAPRRIRRAAARAGHLYTSWLKTPLPLVRPTPEDAPHV